MIGYGITWDTLCFYRTLLSFFSNLRFNKSQTIKWYLFWIISAYSCKYMHILGIQNDKLLCFYPFLWPSCQYRSMGKWVSCLKLYKFNSKRFAIKRRFILAGHVLSCVYTQIRDIKNLTQRQLNGQKQQQQRRICCCFVHRWIAIVWPMLIFVSDGLLFFFCLVAVIFVGSWQGFLVCKSRAQHLDRNYCWKAVI